MIKEVEIKKETFRTEEGEIKEYNSIKLTLLDKTFTLYPKTESKQLLNYLIDVELEAQEDKPTNF